MIFTFRAVTKITKEQERTMRIFLGAVLALLLSAGSVWADMVVVRVNMANIRLTPQLVKSNVILRAPRNYPLEVRGTSGEFLEVADFQETTGWVHNSVVQEGRAVVVSVPKVNIRKGPGKDAPVVVKADRGVAFKVKQEKEGWLEVVHESGTTGWVLGTLVWGE
jgi:SH3-like domain-containing protein